LVLSKSLLTPRAAADVITRATSVPNTFIFTELLLSPKLQALLSASPEHVAYLHLLKVFCYGTYATYKATPNLPPLNPAQTLKLKQLSLLTLAQDPANLTYEKLMAALEITSIRDLENIVISSIYGGLLSGTLDPHNQRITITSISPLRDVSPSTIPTLISTLHEWSQRCSSTLSILESQIAQIRSEAQKRHKEEREWEAAVEKMIEKEGGATNTKDLKDLGAAVGRKLGGGPAGQGQGRKGGEKRNFFGVTGGAGNKEGGEGEMDIDDEEEGDEGARDGGARSLKKRGLGSVSLSFGR
jgi:COP9 signalosome complex subunit 7